MSEWKVDEHGQRYRDVGVGCREYETVVSTSFGNIPESQLAEVTRQAQAAAKAARDREQERQMEDTARTAGKFCPIRNGNSCKPDCALLGDSGCTYICPSTSPSKACPHSGMGACTVSCGAFRGNTEK